MKKSTLLMLALMASSAIQARTLSPEEALARLGNGSDTPAKVRAMTAAGASSMVLAETTLTSRGDAAAYLFTRPQGGYLIVAADDNALPLLGYSDEGTVTADRMPPQMRWWLSQYAEEIANAGENPTVRLNAPGAQKISRPQRAAIEPLVKTLWDQDAPYNNLCPTLGGTRTVTGCVATAMAQLMNYFKYPEKGTGTVYATVDGGSRTSLALSTITFDWDNMLDSYTASYTEAQGNAVANLMKACGYSVSMDYNVADVGGSSALGTAVAPALVNNFGYDSGAKYYMRDYYPLLEWENMIYDNLRNVGPVYYDGDALEGGHAFVCDGYSTDGYFHFNWGWSGAYNGYFLLTALNPEGQGIGGFSGGYNSGQGVCLGIRKPTGQTSATDSPLYFISNSGYPVKCTASGNYVTLNGFWVNMSGKALNISTGLSFTNMETGAEKIVAASGTQNLLANYGMTGTRVNIATAGLANGQYKVKLVTRTSSSNDWVMALAPLGIVDYAIVTKSGSTLSATIPSDSHISITAAELLTPIYANMSAKMSVTFKNNSDTELYRLVTPILYSGNNLLAMADPTAVDLEAGTEETREIEFTLYPVSNALTVGSTYTFGLMDYNEYLIIASLGTLRYQAATTGQLSLSNFKVEGGTNVEDPANIIFSGTVKLASGYYASPFYIAVVESLSTGTVITSATSPAVYLNGGQSSDVQIKLDFSAAVPGTTYYAYFCYAKSNSLTPLANAVPFRIAVNGIDEVEAGAAADLPVEYYTLQGIRIQNPEKGGIYIRRQGAEVTKIRF